jgi:hypothetical protein
LITVAQQHIREHFEKHRNESDKQKIKELMKIAGQAEIIVKKNIVQAWQKQNDPTTFGTKL